MEIPAIALQTGGSLVAIFALFLLARWMKLGGAPGLDSEEGVRRAASEVIDGFEAEAVALSDDGAAGLARDRQGRHILIKRHGNKFAGRLLDYHAWAESWRDNHPDAKRRPRITVDSGDRLFGKVTLFTDEPETWAEAINTL